MRKDRISAADQARVIPALIEHADIEAHHVCKVDCSAHTARVRTDDHHVLGIHLEFRLRLEEGLDELVDGLHGLKALQRNRVLHARVMRVKGQNVIDAHVDELVECQRTVQGLAAASPVHTALVEEGHDYVDAARLTCRRRDDALQVRKVIVRRHVVRHAAERIGQAVVTDIHHEEEILAAHRL